jgi:hypothetical protein
MKDLNRQHHEKHLVHYQFQLFFLASLSIDMKDKKTIYIKNKDLQLSSYTVDFNLIILQIKRPKQY